MRGKRLKSTVVLAALLLPLALSGMARAVDDAVPLPEEVETFLAARQPDSAPRTPSLIREQVLPALRALAANATLRHALRAENDRSLALTAQEIERLNQQRRHADPSPAAETLRQTLRKTLARGGLANTRLYLSNNRGLLTAATRAPETFELGDWGGWKRIYLSSPETAFVETVAAGDDGRRTYRIEIGVWDPAEREAVGVLIAEVSAPETPNTEESDPAHGGDEFHVR